MTEIETKTQNQSLNRETRKKVLVFSLMYHPSIGGAEIAAKEIIDRLAETQFDVVTLRFRGGEPKFESIGNANVYRVGWNPFRNYFSGLGGFVFKINKYLFPFMAFWKAKRLQKKENYGATFSVMASYAGFAALFFKMKFPDVPFILNLQEGDPIDYIKKRARFVYPLFRRIFTKADIVHAISNFLREYARGMGFRGRVEVIPNGVDVKHFSSFHTPEQVDDLRKALGKKAGEIYLITVSRLAKKNAVNDIILSLKYLPDKVKLLVAGVGEERKALEELAENEKLSARVNFLGAIKYQEVPKYLKASDIFVRPSLSEGFGNSFIEAMAAKISVIATPVGGIVDFLYAPHKDNRKNIHQKPTGIFCQPKNPKSIAESILMLVKNPELKNTIVDNAYALVSSKYDWDLVAKHMRKKVFDRILGGNETCVKEKNGQN